MNTYFVRAGLSGAYAYEHIDEEGRSLLDLISALPADYACQRLCYRFTFVLLRLTASSAKEAREIVERVWAKLHPENARELTVYAVADPGGDRGELIESVFSNYYGVDPYVELIASLCEEIPQLESRGALRALRAQNYLFAIDGGCGFSTLLSSFGNYLQRMGVFGEESENRKLYSEFLLGAATEGGRTCPDDMIDQLRADEGGEQRSVIGLDVSCFLEGGKTDELRRLARRLYPFQDRLVFVFRVPFLEKQALEDVASTLSDQMLLRVVAIPPLHEIALFEQLWNNVRANGYSCDHRLAEAFFARIRREKQDGRFYGYKTTEKLAQEIILEKAKNDAARVADGQEPGATLILPEDLPALAQKPKKTGYDALNELIGMEKIAARVREIVSQVKISMSNEKLDRPCIHMRFLGAPGTGKTTVARIIGQIFREEGILRKGAFMEYTSRELCAEYVGQTAVKTAAICRDAYGSVLFIDEAYALYENTYANNDYGKEALTTLISEMENHRDDMLVIMAGYTDDMETLMKGNAGLRSRMPYAITFESYTRTQLFEIFMLMVRKHFDYTPAFESEARAYFDSLSDSYLASKEFANARFVRNLYERAWSKSALRAALAGQTAVELRREDFLAASGEKEFSEKLEVKTKIGF